MGGVRAAAPVCEAAAQLDEKVESLGQLFNDLEDAVHNLEGVDEHRRKDLHALRERVLRCETTANERTQSAEAALVKLQEKDSTQAKNIVSLEEKLTLHESLLHSLAERLQQQDSESDKPATLTLHKHSTHELANAFLQRLHGGDVLDPVILIQLQNALGSTLNTWTPIPNVTPPLTHGSTRRSTLSSNADGESLPKIKRPPGRPPRSSTESEPLLKKRGRPRKDSLVGNIDDKPSAKRPLEGKSDTQYPAKRRKGRPPKNTGTSSKTGTATRPMIAGQALKGTLQRKLAEARLTDQTKPTSSSDRASAENGHNIDTLGTAAEAVHESPCQEEERLPNSVPDASEPVEYECPAYLPTSEMDGDVDIPAERRSTRAPKPSKAFGDVMTWKEASLHI